jgi:hypothetical protein
VAEEPAARSNPAVVSGFKGLNNRVDPVRLGLTYQLTAENALCDDAGFLVRRPGVTTLTSSYKDMFGTRDGRLLLITTGDALVERFTSGAESIIATGVTGAPFHWCELGYALFVQSKAKTAKWAIYPGRVIEWGSLCPALSEPTYPVGDPQSYPPPYGDVIGVRRSQIVVGVYEPTKDRSVLYYSQPDAPHEFRLDSDYALVAGRVTLLAGLPQGMIVGTDRAIYVDTPEQPMQKLSDFGVRPNAAYLDDKGMAYLWTDRGLYRALPFEAMTDAVLAPTIRQIAAVGRLPHNGSDYMVVTQTGPETGKKTVQGYVPVAITITKTQGIS